MIDYLRSFSYQELWIEWTVWALGWSLSDSRGWDYDTLTIFVGPWRFSFLSAEQMYHGEG